MPTVQSRLIPTALWPVSVWMSFAHFNEHPVDDYVVRTIPIVAIAISFWVALGAIAALWLTNGPYGWFQVLLLALPLLYLIGLAMYASRDDRFSS